MNELVSHHVSVKTSRRFFIFCTKNKKVCTKNNTDLRRPFLNLRKSVLLYQQKSVFDAEQPAEESYKDVSFLRFLGWSVRSRFKSCRIILQ